MDHAGASSSLAHPPLPEFPSPPAGLAVRHLEGEGRGRCLVAGPSGFKRGDVVLRQRPYVAVFDDAKACDTCGATGGGLAAGGGTLKRCTGCQACWYCSAKCQKSAWKEHKAECKVWGKWTKEHHAPAPTMRLLWRLFARRRSAAAANGVEGEGERQVDSLVTHRSELPGPRLVTYSQMAAAIAAGARGTVDGLPIEGAEEELVDMEDGGAVGRAVEELVGWMACLACNAHSICDGELRQVGKALYPAVAMANHSCRPSCALLFDGRDAVLRATDPIPPGGEVSISYVEIAQPTPARRRALEEGYFFQCGCPRCTETDARHSAAVELEAVLAPPCTATPGCQGTTAVPAPPTGAGAGGWVCSGCGEGAGAGAAEVAEGLDRRVEDGRNLRRGGSGDPRAALDALQGALGAAGRSAPPGSLRAAGARDEMVHCLIDLGEYGRALEVARETIADYTRIHSEYAPMVGLQYALVGKLEWYQGDSGAAVRSLRQGLKRLEVSHGASHPLVGGVANLLAEAEAEAKHKAGGGDEDC